MIFFHLLFANLLFIQSVPPPPPPGGSELQSLRIIRDADGSNIPNINIKEAWWPMEQAVLYGKCLKKNNRTTKYCSYESIMQGMENGYIKITKGNEVWFMWQFASDLAQKRRVCQIVLDSNINLTGVRPWECENDPQFSVPIPIWSKLLLFLSLIGLWFRYYKSSEALSK